MRLSQVLVLLAAEPEERISFRDILAILSERSFAILVVLLGLPNCLPMPPPIPTVSALLLIMIALQMLVRRPEPWFPGVVLRGSVARSDVLRAVKRALPVVSRLERWSRPRLSVFEPRLASLLSAILLLLMSVGMLLAAPLIGQVPYGLAVCLFGLGQIERDGVLVLSGMAAGAVGVALSASFIYGVVEAIRNLV
ncbi:exopolysaccharide biosynthesis protein [Lichenibacterium minor]|uniref:Exopolysaccharide biosynthesis protein n=1 Tax=Lichenibacterium minor TaxID=2316528 RepID=A0A4Q2U9K6_9HYPH|nr:exopolysaccharide biosynthesis protein [Lichenibacterium minor]RYC32608.1 exopolysaccharide biosynthesis protein [Lichenibacterium minor]